ncbi:MAG: TetR/AcrR family transcriptional regulator [Planctomycetes bacterium]|nr:TetR/AcrR family transcriptional regulator [Planctomycetota bacterium]
MAEKTRTPKSARTRAALLEAARELFAERGYVKVTVRDIAAKAGIDPAMVIRYFGSKDGIFADAAEFNLELPDLRGVARNSIGEALTRHFLSIWDSPDAGLPVLLRSASTNELANARMREIFNKQIRTALEAIAGPDEAEQRAGLVSSQLLGLAVCRYVLKLPPVVRMSKEQLVKTIGKTLQQYITGRLPR